MDELSANVMKTILDYLKLLNIYLEFYYYRDIYLYITLL